MPSLLDRAFEKRGGDEFSRTLLSREQRVAASFARQRIGFADRYFSVGCTCPNQ